jgi:type IV secretory pathway ATPase VirB11/archaellum biosynthesis ATPase
MNLESEGEVSLRRLIREALRMRPDRLVLGEIKLIELKISIPIKTFFGMEFYLTSTSHAT